MTIPVRNKSVAAEFEARAARADLLARASPSVAEPLRFVAGIMRAQGDIAAALETIHAAEPLSGRLAPELEGDIDRVLAHCLDVVRFAARAAPTPLADESRLRASENVTTAKSRLQVFWRGDRTPAEDYLSRAMLRPYVETLRALGIAPDRERARGRCPHCASAPIASARRGGSESDGNLRFLVCGLCGLEWSFPRILCPSCFENDPHKLPSFKSDAHPAVRIEACETCRRYTKSLDLSLDARPVPEIDDVVSLALDLWAVEQGFTRIEPGLVGV